MIVTSMPSMLQHWEDKRPVLGPSFETVLVLLRLVLVVPKIAGSVYAPVCTFTPGGRCLTLCLPDAGRQVSPRLALKPASKHAALQPAVPILGTRAAAVPCGFRTMTLRGNPATGASIVPACHASTAHAPSEHAQEISQAAVLGRWEADQAGMERGKQQGPKQASSRTNRSLSGAFAELSEGTAARSGSSPVYVSRSQRQSSMSQSGVVEQWANQRVPRVAPSLTASPALSEMVYSLPVTPKSHFSLVNAGLLSSGSTPARLAAESTGSAGGAEDTVPTGMHFASGVHDSAAGFTPARPLAESTGSAGGAGLSMPPAAWVHESPARAGMQAGEDSRELVGRQGAPDSSAPAEADSSAYIGKRTLTGASNDDKAAVGSLPESFSQHPGAPPAELEGAGEESEAGGDSCQPMCNYQGHSADGSHRRETDSSYRSCEPEEAQGRGEVLGMSYSGFSSEMRAAANATAESLFRQAEASSAGSRRSTAENGCRGEQQQDLAHADSSGTPGRMHTTGI